MKRTISILLVMCLLSVFSLPTYATSTKGDNTKFTIKAVKTTKEFDKASDDTIVIYFDNVGITKAQIIGKEEITGQKTSDFTIMSDPDLYRLPSGIRNAQVVKEITGVPGYTQKNVYMYLSSTEGHRVASDLDFNATTSFIWLMLGVIPKVGIPLACTGFLVSWRDAQIAANIRAYADQNQSLIIKTNTSIYGTFTTVLYWDGIYVDISGVQPEKLVSFSYR